MAIPLNLPQRNYVKAFYKLDEVSGNRFDGSSGGNHTATDVNTVGSAAGKINLGALFVSANSEYFTIVDHTDLKPTGDFSISFWVKRDGIPAGQLYTFNSCSENANPAGFRTYIHPSTGVINMLSGKNSGLVNDTDYAVCVGTTNVCDNSLHHIVFTSDGTNLKLYVDNGAAETTKGWAHAPVYAATNYVRIGDKCTDGTESLFHDGLVDELILWNGVALSQAEVLQVYNISTYQFAGGFSGFSPWIF